jgi:hypothetical protein
MTDSPAGTDSGVAGDPPRTLFEAAILEAARQLLPFSELLRAFMDERLAVPSAEPVDTSFLDLRPPTWNVDGEEYVAVFTHPTRADGFQSEYPYLGAVTGRALLRMIRPEVSIIVDPRVPGYEFRIPAAALELARQQFG